MRKVSIVMPVYNGSRYIGQAIESILNQSFRDFELIIINDGSTDDSVFKARAYSDARIKIIDRIENFGLAVTRNEGVAAACGTYVAMLDCDDIACSTRLEEQVRFLDQNPDFGLVGSWVELIDVDGCSDGDVWRYETSSLKIPCALLFNNRFAQSAVMIRKDILPEGPYRLEFPPAEDYDLWVRLLPQTRVANIPKPLVRYRVHPGGTSRKQAMVAEANTRKIVIAQINRLGINPDEGQVEIHRLIGRGEGAIDVETLGRAVKWIDSLFAANMTAGVYSQEAFCSILGEKWAAFCQASSHIGWDSFMAFHRSPFRKYAQISAGTLCRFMLRSLFKI
ncbi:glycosyltransferase [Deltaproteobacteria bacterium IMCC39524]|nr:glycosyltransferase [Deltaproteobacteria bacterium IMCC39524]